MNLEPYQKLEQIDKMMMMIIIESERDFDPSVAKEFRLDSSDESNVERLRVRSISGTPTSASKSRSTRFKV